MNKKQRMLSFVALGIFALTVVFAPWNVVTKDGNGHVYDTWTRYQPVFLVPKVGGWGITGATLAWQPLLCTWLALGIAHGSLIFLLRTPK